MWVSDIDSRINIANYHNDVRTDIFYRKKSTFYMCFQVDCGNTEKLILPKILKLFYIQAAFNDIFPESVFFNLQPVIFCKIFI